MPDPTPETVLRFWLDEVGPEGWYAAGPELDARCRAEMAPLAALAARGALVPWLQRPEGALALAILLDQMPRNIHRGTPAAFASDWRARGVVVRAIRRGQDMAVAEPERQFFYLPFMHSESPEHQCRAVRLIQSRLPETGAENLRHAILHRDVIRRFGRFPSRNAVLGRTDSPAERAWRDGGGYMG